MSNFDLTTGLTREKKLLLLGEICQAHKRTNFQLTVVGDFRL